MEPSSTTTIVFQWLGGLVLLALVPCYMFFVARLVAYGAGKGWNAAFMEDFNPDKKKEK